MDDQLKEFNNWLKLRGRSNNTRRNYCQRIKNFLKEIDNNITEETINKYLLNLQDNCTNKTINCYRDAISAYIQWKKLDIKLPPMLKETKKIPDAITLEEFENQVIPVVKRNFDNSEKIMAIFYLLFYSGLRPSEIVALKRKDIDLENLQGKVYRQKTDKEDIFMFSKKVSDLMKIYFLTEEEEINAFNVTTRSIGRMCEKIKDKFPNFNLRPYLFRHSSATRLLREGFNLLDIQEFLGHTNLNSTMKYLRTSKEELKKKYLEKIK